MWNRKLILFAVRHWNAADVDEDENEETKDKRYLSHIIPVVVSVASVFR